MSLEIKGQVVKIMEPVTGVSKTTGKDWKKDEFVIRTDGEYPKEVCIQHFKELPIKLNEMVSVSINIESNEHNGRYYTNISAWKVDPVNGGTAPNPVNDAMNTPVPPAPTDGNDNLPF